MSVVNKMLNDLEKRGAGDPVTANYIPPAKKARTRVWVWALVIVLSLAVIAVLLMPGKPTPQHTVPVKAVPTVAVTPDTLADDNPPLPAANVQSQPAMTTEPSDQNNHEAPVATDEPTTPRAVQPDANVSDRPEKSDPMASAPPKEALTVSTSGQATTPNAGLREQIRLALEAGQTLEAIALMQELLVREPDNLALVKKLAATLFAAGQRPAAEQLLTQQLSVQPQAHSVRLMLARLYMHVNQRERAIDLLESADAHTPVSLALLSFRGELLHDARYFDRALNDYVQLTARDPGNARWWLGLGVSADALGYDSQARAAYQQALTLGQLKDEVASYMRTRINALAGGEQ